MRKSDIAALAAALMLTLSACSTADTPATESTTTPAPTANAAADPYEIYLENNPDPDLVISREDAQTRALLGCGTEWAPGTVDAVLADAYSEQCAKVANPDPAPEPEPGEADPYDVYLENNPDPDLVLSREDAQLRASLGCGTDWAPGTIDAVLQDAYGC